MKAASAYKRLFAHFQFLLFQLTFIPQLAATACCRRFFLAVHTLFQPFCFSLYLAFSLHPSVSPFIHNGIRTSSLFSIQLYCRCSSRNIWSPYALCSSCPLLCSCDECHSALGRAPCSHRGELDGSRTGSCELFGCFSEAD